jgi:hypothetical protein
VFFLLPGSDYWEIIKNGVFLCVYALVFALGRYQKHSKERGLLPYALYITLFHGAKVVAYALLYDSQTIGFFVEFTVYTLHYMIFAKLVFVTLQQDAVFWKNVSMCITCNQFN